MLDVTGFSASFCADTREGKSRGLESNRNLFNLWGKGPFPWNWGACRELESFLDLLNSKYLLCHRSLTRCALLNQMEGSDDSNTQPGSGAVHATSPREENSHVFENLIPYKGVCTRQIECLFFQLNNRRSTKWDFLTLVLNLSWSGNCCRWGQL